MKANPLSGPVRSQLSELHNKPCCSKTATLSSLSGVFLPCGMRWISIIYPSSVVVWCISHGYPCDWMISHWEKKKISTSKLYYRVYGSNKTHSGHISVSHFRSFINFIDWCFSQKPESATQSKKIKHFVGLHEHLSTKWFFAIGEFFFYISLPSFNWSG